MAIILLVDDDPATLFSYSEFLISLGHQVHTAQSFEAGRKTLQDVACQAILLDLCLPDGNGMDWIEEIRKSLPDVALCIITGHGNVPLAVEAMKRGADHFLTKPANLDELAIFLQKSLELSTLRKEHLSRRRVDQHARPCFGDSFAMQRVKDLALIAARKDSPVLLLGETGTGKGLLAKWIHQQSPRKSAEFVEVNCSSFSGELLGSELFGHVRGAFTSAAQDHQGLLEVADSGTLFLDEIGDMEKAIQAKLLKVIEEKHFRRLGDNKIRRSDFRLVCATNQELAARIADKTFRHDLYYRIHVFPIRLPPLRERAEDIPPLVDQILSSLGCDGRSRDPAFMRELSRYRWPGNIRELRNVLERAVLLAEGKPLGPEHLPGLSPAGGAPARGIPKSIWNLKEIEEERIKAAFVEFGGDVDHMVAELGLSRSTLYRKLGALGLV